ncbi:hypothetical protein [Bradyrhizobium yuanmingense]|uniref:hypothetical protein n=1 Tax=Bradyrhizobium yuanmingense TaxID=108015 RepID=UPI0035138A8F
MTKSHNARAEIEAWIMSDFMDDAAAYMSRGRRFLALSNAAVVDAWVEAYESSALAWRDQALLDALNDCYAELTLRAIPPPYHRVESATEILEATFQEELSKLSPQLREEIEEERRADFRAFLSRSQAQKN